VGQPPYDLSDSNGGVTDQLRSQGANGPFKASRKAQRKGVGVKDTIGKISSLGAVVSQAIAWVYYPEHPAISKPALLAALAFVVICMISLYLRKVSKSE
jgi:hypothetical protein